MPEPRVTSGLLKAPGDSAELLGVVGEGHRKWGVSPDLTLTCRSRCTL